MKIHELSKMTGVNSETIRLYRTKGLLHPYKNPQNGYYEYSTEDFFTLFHIRKLRSAGTSIKKISAIYQNSSIQDIIVNFRESILTAEEEIKRLEKKIKQLRLGIRHLEECNNPESEFRLLEIAMGKYDVYSLFDQDRHSLESWMNSPGVCCISLHIEPGVLNSIPTADYVPFQLGLGAYENIIKDHNLSDLENMYYYPNGTYLTSVIKMDNLSELKSEQIIPLKKYASEHHLHFAGGTTGFLIGISKQGKNPEYSFRIRAQVEKIKARS